MSQSSFDPAQAAFAADAKAWPFAEARNVLKRLSQQKDDDPSRPVYLKQDMARLACPILGHLVRSCARQWCVKPLKY